MAARHRAPDVFASGLGRIDIDGGIARYVFTSFDGSAIEPTLVMPVASLLDALRKQVEAIEWARESGAERLLHGTH